MEGLTPYSRIPHTQHGKCDIRLILPGYLGKLRVEFKYLNRRFIETVHPALRIEGGRNNENRKAGNCIQKKRNTVAMAPIEST